MTVYQKALEALKECVKDAMDSNVDANTQGEIWRHYQGMKAIEKQIGRSSMSFKLDGIDRVMDYDPDYNICLLYTSPSPRDATLSRMPSSA